jgi:hypothetical protein
VSASWPIGATTSRHFVSSDFSHQFRKAKAALRRLFVVAGIDRAILGWDFKSNLGGSDEDGGFDYRCNCDVIYDRLLDAAPQPGKYDCAPGIG